MTMHGISIRYLDVVFNVTPRWAQVEKTCAIWLANIAQVLSTCDENHDRLNINLTLSVFCYYAFLSASIAQVFSTCAK